MATFFLVIIYLAFISLGLPDSLLGAAWPVMQRDYGVSLDTAGLLSMSMAGGTIISSLASGKVIGRFGTGKVTFVSVLMTAVALLGFYFSPSLVWLFIFAIPLGLGAGSVDAGLNNYVATHYKAHHMSWLHCFWGVGATMGPIIMSQFISTQNSWRNGYLTISLIQFALVVVLFLTLPLWKKVGGAGMVDDTKEVPATTPQEPGEQLKKANPLRIKGVKLAMVSFLLYCGAEAAAGLWGSSFLVAVKDLPAGVAAQWVSLYYGGITAGRLITGFITFKMSNIALIRSGLLVAMFGAVLVILPLPSVFLLTGFILIGMGFAPVFPCMIHETPVRFGKEHSQAIIGYQMALAYTGSTFIPPLLGLMAAHITIGIFPYFIAILVVALFACSERLNILVKKGILFKGTKRNTTAM
ncbi:Fucose permease [Fictibacillus enclensis]|uniref:MFS transporter n=1 Tax=Fictibacillus enclensis TaxID=1017270 RepID=A0A0V8JC36_9BACL|nr:MFS transporter [Fictibacillus enclensis]KSU84444.1 MFS transporter [Fictibacillus enclensis]SCB79602.1 Fucose permease [Fictibacillus enclensis]